MSKVLQKVSFDAVDAPNLSEPSSDFQDRCIFGWHGIDDRLEYVVPGGLMLHALGARVRSIAFRSSLGFDDDRVVGCAL